METVENSQPQHYRKQRKQYQILNRTRSVQDSSEIFDTYKQGILKVTEGISKFQPQYAEAISKLTARIHTTDKTIR